MMSNLVENGKASDKDCAKESLEFLTGHLIWDLLPESVVHGLNYSGVVYKRGKLKEERRSSASL